MTQVCVPLRERDREEVEVMIWIYSFTHISEICNPHNIDQIRTPTRVYLYLNSGASPRAIFDHMLKKEGRLSGIRIVKQVLN